jgi:putative transcriptional regulator
VGEVHADVAAGMLLVAVAEMGDPNFAGAVVLLLEADDEGALGVVLNRPSPVPVADVLRPWADRCDEPEVLFQGGPVSTDGALAVACLAPGVDAPQGFRPLDGLGGRVGLVDLDAPVEEMMASLAGLRIYAGYAGWGAEQLAEEIAEGSWHVVPGEIADLFREDNDTLRRDVLRRQPGERAWLATRPADPNRN